LKTLWNGLAPTYSNYDSVMQTFYYTLVNMLKLNKAHHIYEVGCGTGRLIPYTIGLKPEDCTYLATDLSDKMVESSRHFLASYINKLGVSESIDKWQEKQRLEIGVHDGESSFKTVHKFDRIIANLVLQSTPDPRKMMTSFREVSEEGALLGITIWGDKTKSNFYTLPSEARAALNKPASNIRENFHLYNKLEQLGSETGWELVVQWEQNSPFSATEFDPELTKAIREVSEIDAGINTFVEKKVKETFSAKKTLNFPVQLAIFRRK
jgi:SAM-dependent methyltransferase